MAVQTAADRHRAGLIAVEFKAILAGSLSYVSCVVALAGCLAVLAELSTCFFYCCFFFFNLCLHTFILHSLLDFTLITKQEVGVLSCWHLSVFVQ